MQHTRLLAGQRTCSSGSSPRIFFTSGTACAGVGATSTVAPVRSRSASGAVLTAAPAGETKYRRRWPSATNLWPGSIRSKKSGCTCFTIGLTSCVESGEEEGVFNCTTKGSIAASEVTGIFASGDVAGGRSSAGTPAARPTSPLPALVQPATLDIHLRQRRCQRRQTALDRPLPIKPLAGALGPQGEFTLPSVNGEAILLLGAAAQPTALVKLDRSPRGQVRRPTEVREAAPFQHEPSPQPVPP